MEKYTREVAVHLYDGMSNPTDKTITVRVTNDAIDLTEGHKATFFSDAKCRFEEFVYDEEPTDDELAELVRKSERAEFAYVD